MSVLKRDQKETDIFFLILIRELSSEAATMLEKRKKDKFYNAYAPYVLESCVNMYNEAFLANNIMISKTSPEFDFNNRRLHFQNVLGQLDFYENIINLFVMTAIEQKSFNKDKAFKFLENNASKIVKIRASITKIIKKDLEKYKRYEADKIRYTRNVELKEEDKWYKEKIEKQKNSNKIIQPIVFY